MITVLDWAEKSAIENMKDHVNNADLIQKQASTLLTMLLSGAGAALYFGVDHEALRMAAVAISIWLFILAGCLTRKCLMFGDFPSVWNEPKNLYQKSYELDKLREVELKNLQIRIDDAMNLNFEKSLRLNACIVATCFTPIIGILFWFFSESRFFA